MKTLLKKNIAFFLAFVMIITMLPVYNVSADEIEDPTPEHTHQWIESTKTESTCTKDGSIHYTCSGCEETKDEVIKATGHASGSPVKENETAASCTVNGSYDNVTYCTVCKEKISSNTVTIPATGHKWGAYVDTTPATEEKEGIATRTCSSCGETETKTIDKLAHVHSYDNGVITTQPGCTTPGVKTYTCSCGHSKTEAISATGHSWGEYEVTTPATEKAEGVDTRTCSNCGATETKAIPKLKHTHNYKDTITTEPTCITPGVRTYTCPSCGDTYTVAIAMIDHVEGPASIENEKDATCTTPGSYDTVIRCTVCTKIISKTTATTPALGHKEGPASIENEKDATCTTPGSYDTVVRCTVCNAIVSKTTTTTPALGHKEGPESIENEKDATCTVAGSYDTVTRCTTCNAIVSKKTTVIPATGHNYATEGTVTKEPTCTQKGVRSFFCTNKNCTAARTEAIDALGHDEGVLRVENMKEATTKAAGSYDNVLRCGRCNIILSTEHIIIPKVTLPATDIALSESKLSLYTECSGYEKEADLTAILTPEDSTDFVIWESSDSSVASVDETGHVIGLKAGTVVITATVSTNSDLKATCTVNVYEHDTKIDKAVAVTCTKDGITEGSHCERCKEVFVAQEIIKATGHDYKYGTTKATSAKNGMIATRCTKCNLKKAGTKSTTIYKIKSVKLTKTSYSYDGKAKKPTVTVVDSKNKKISTKYYTVQYSAGRKNVGKYTVTITFKTRYAGTFKRTFTINKAAQKISASGKTLTVGNSVRCGASRTGNGSLSYKSSNSGVARVSASGVITAVGTGTAKITITAAGTANYKKATKTITVTVKSKYVAPAKTTTTTTKKKKSTSSSVSVWVKGSYYHSSKHGSGTFTKKSLSSAKSSGCKACPVCY